MLCLLERLPPGIVPDPCGLLGGSHDVGEHDGGKHAVEHATVRQRVLPRTCAVRGPPESWRCGETGHQSPGGSSTNREPAYPFGDVLGRFHRSGSIIDREVRADEERRNIYSRQDGTGVDVVPHLLEAERLARRHRVSEELREPLDPLFVVGRRTARPLSGTLAREPGFPRRSGSTRSTGPRLRPTTRTRSRETTPSWLAGRSTPNRSFVPERWRRRRIQAPHLLPARRARPARNR